MSEAAGRQTALYYEWRDESFPFFVDLSVDVVREVCRDLLQQLAKGQEVTGFLYGRSLAGEIPTLRIDEYQRLEGKRPAGTPSRLGEPLGYVRSQVGGGPLGLTQGDVRRLTATDAQQIRLAMIVRGEEPRRAGLLSLPEDVAGRPEPPLEFAFDPEILSRSARLHRRPILASSWRTSRVETAAERAAMAEQSRVLTRSTTGDRDELAEARTGFAPRRHWALLLFSFSLALVFAAGLLLRPFLTEAGFEAFLPAPQPQIGLAVTNVNGLLDVTWNQNLPELRHAMGAKLIVRDNAREREIGLTSADLTMGHIVYQPAGNDVNLTLALVRPDESEVRQSVAWQASSEAAR